MATRNTDSPQIKADPALIETISQAVAAAVSTLSVNPSSNAVVNAVAMKFPSFWTSNPTSWFTTAEANFRLKGIITDSTKYFHVIQSLDSDTSSKVHRFVTLGEDVLDRYAQLKNALLEACGKPKANC